MKIRPNFDLSSASDYAEGRMIEIRGKIKSSKGNNMNVSRKDIDRKRIREIVAAQEQETRLPGGELFGGHTINWYKLGDGFLERSGNFIRSFIDPKYEKIVQEEFFANLQHRVNIHATSIQNEQSQPLQKAKSITFLRNIINTDLPEAQRYELIIQAVKANPDLENITTEDIKNSKKEIENPKLVKEMVDELDKLPLSLNEKEAIMANPRVLKISKIQEFKDMIYKENPMWDPQKDRLTLQGIYNKEKSLIGKHPKFKEMFQDKIDQLDSLNEVTDEEKMKNLALLEACRELTIGNIKKGDFDNEQDKFFAQYPRYRIITTKEDYKDFERDWKLFKSTQKAENKPVNTIYNEALNFFDQKKDDSINNINKALRGDAIDSEKIKEDYPEVHTQKALEQFKLDYAKKIVEEITENSNDPKNILNNLEKIDTLEFTKGEKIALKNYIVQNVKAKICSLRFPESPKMQAAIAANPRYQKASVKEFEAMLAEEHPRKIQKNPDKYEKTSDDDLLVNIKKLPKEVPKEPQEQLDNKLLFVTYRRKIMANMDNEDKFFSIYPQHYSISTKGDFELFRRDFENFNLASKKAESAIDIISTELQVIGTPEDPNLVRISNTQTSQVKANKIHPHESDDDFTMIDERSEESDDFTSVGSKDNSDIESTEYDESDDFTTVGTKDTSDIESTEYDSENETENRAIEEEIRTMSAYLDHLTQTKAVRLESELKTIRTTYETKAKAVASETELSELQMEYAKAIIKKTAEIYPLRPMLGILEGLVKKLTKNPKLNFSDEQKEELISFVQNM